MNKTLKEVLTIVKSGLKRTIYLIDYTKKLEKRIEALENNNTQELEREDRWKVYGEE
jgi:hypothetical protein